MLVTGQRLNFLLLGVKQAGMFHFCSPEDPVQLQCLLPTGRDWWLRVGVQRNTSGQGELYTPIGVQLR